MTFQDGFRIIDCFVLCVETIMWIESQNAIFCRLHVAFPLQDCSFRLSDPETFSNWRPLGSQHTSLPPPAYPSYWQFFSGVRQSMSKNIIISHMYFGFPYRQLDRMLPDDNPGWYPYNYNPRVLTPVDMGFLSVYSVTCPA